MIVAPVVVVALLGLRSLRAKAIALGTVAAVFSLLEISASAAATWDGALGALGVPSRSVADPSDLVGLAMLPIAWWLVRERTERTQPSSAALQRSALALAVFACVATSAPPGPGIATWSTGAWIENRTTAPLTVRLRWPDAQLSCLPLAETDLGLAVPPDVFGAGITFELAPGGTVPIEPAHARAALMPGTPGATTRNPCDVVRISIDGLEDRIVSFELPTLTAVPTSSSSGPIPSGGLAAIETGGDLSLEVPAAIYRSSIVVERAPVPPASCGEARGEGIAHGDLAVLGDGRWTLESRTLLADGCTELVLVSEEDATRVETIFLCVPGDFIPFEPGDAIALATGEETRLDGDDGTALVLITGASSVRGHGLVLAVDRVDVSCAERVACDAVVAPALVRRGGGGDPIAIGETLDFAADGGRSGRALVARAEHVIVAPVSCDAGRASATTRIDVVMVLGSSAGVP